MSSGNFTLNNMGRIGADKSDNSQRNLSNTKYGNYNLENYNKSIMSDSHVKFATNNHMVNFNSSVGGLPGNIVDVDSLYLLNQKKNVLLRNCNFINVHLQLFLI